MNLIHLRNIVMVDRTGSFTAAAQALNTTQSSVTKSVAWVERETGYALFDRKARGVTATEAGREVIDRAARIVADFDRLIGDIAAARQQRDETLRIGVAPPSLEGLLNRAVRAMMRDAAGFRLFVQAGGIQRNIGLLGRGDIDLLVAPAEDLRGAPDLTLQELPPFTGHMFVRRGHPLLAAEAPAILGVAVTDFPLIVPDLTAPMTARLMADLDPSGRGFRVIHVLDSFPMVARLVQTTDAIGIVSASYLRTNSFRRLFRTLATGHGYAMPLAVAWRARWMPTRPMQRFLNAICEFPPV